MVQAALAEGKSVSLEVVPGPGLWARARFLRDLEALLGGLDAGGGGGEPCDGGAASDACSSKKQPGPTVLLVEGHSRNRSGGGADLSHGTKFMGEVAPQRGAAAGNRSEPGDSLGVGPAGGLPLVSLAARRAKLLLEEAAQCLHDLSDRYGETPTPFKAILATTRSASSSEDKPQNGAKGSRGGLDEYSEAHGILGTGGSRGTEDGELDGSLAPKGSAGMELLLAACHMIIHPDRRYDVGEGLIDGRRSRSHSSSSRDVAGKVQTVGLGLGRAHETETTNEVEGEPENSAILAYASRLAKTCRAELCREKSARGVAEALRGSALDAVPLEVAVALRRLVRHPNWPATSPRPDFAECPASEAFVGWVVAAVAGGTELALEGGGGLHEPGVGPNQAQAAPDMAEMNEGVSNPAAGSHARKIDLGWPIAGSDEGKTLSSLRDAQEERRRERAVLRGTEAALVHENITVVDDDSPWLLPPERADGERNGQNRRGRRQCRSSEALNVLMETVLRPFNVRISFLGSTRWCRWSKRP